MEIVPFLVFDFDNVIVRGSEYFKQTAWNNLFESASQEAVRLHEARAIFRDGRGDRYDILRHVFALNKNVEVEVQAASVRFDGIVQKLIRERTVHPHDREALRILARHSKLHIVSNTPEVALQETIAYFSTLYSGFDKLFGLVLGTPKKKPENLEVIRSIEECSFSNMVMIGDGENDRLAAEETGTNFIGVTVVENREKWQDMSFQKIGHISELPQLFGLM